MKTHILLLISCLCFLYCCTAVVVIFESEAFLKVSCFNYIHEVSLQHFLYKKYSVLNEVIKHRALSYQSGEIKIIIFFRVKICVCQPPLRLQSIAVPLCQYGFNVVI